MCIKKNITLFKLRCSNSRIMSIRLYPHQSSYKCAFCSCTNHLRGWFITCCLWLQAASSHWCIYVGCCLWECHGAPMCADVGNGATSGQHLGAAEEKSGFWRNWGGWGQKRASWVDVLKWRRKEGKHQQCSWGTADNNVESARRKIMGPDRKWMNRSGSESEFVKNKFDLLKSRSVMLLRRWQYTWGV